MAPNLSFAANLRTKSYWDYFLPAGDDYVVIDPEAKEICLIESKKDEPLNELKNLDNIYYWGPEEREEYGEMGPAAVIALKYQNLLRKWNDMPISEKEIVTKDIKSWEAGKKKKPRTKNNQKKIESSESGDVFYFWILALFVISIAIILFFTGIPSNSIYVDSE